MNMLGTHSDDEIASDNIGHGDPKETPYNDDKWSEREKLPYDEISDKSSNSSYDSEDGLAPQPLEEGDRQRQHWNSQPLTLKPTPTQESHPWHLSLSFGVAIACML